MRVVRRYWEHYRLQDFPVGESMTEQAHAQASDVNYIFEKYARMGMSPPPDGRPVQYADVTALQRDLQERISFAQRTFADVQQAAERLAKVDQGAAEAAAGAAANAKSEVVPG